MSMVLSTIIITIIIVFAITAVGFGIGKANKFGEVDDLIDIKEED